jgi:small subunit ribosomal protein S2
MQLIDLNITWQKIQEVGQLLQKLMGEDKNVVFVGTNERAVSTVIKEYADKHSLHNITSRWLGGTLTNPVTRNRINYLRELESMEQSGMMDSISAKEKSFLSKKLKKLRKNLGGLKNIKGAMHAMVIVDPVHDINATLEALKKTKNLIIIAIADTNCRFSPDLFDQVIPCNTSSLRSLRVVMDELVKYIELGRQKQGQRPSIVAGPSRKVGSAGADVKGLRKPSPFKVQSKESAQEEAAAPKSKPVEKKAPKAKEEKASSDAPETTTENTEGKAE